MSRDHRKLKAFQLSDQLVLEIYRATRGFPREEQFGLTAQLWRSAASVPTNIVEGCGRRSEGEYVNSLRETGYHLSLASRLGYMDPEVAAKLHELQEEAARVLSGLLDSYRR